MCYVKRNKNLFLALIKRKRANREYKYSFSLFRRKTENGIANMQQQFVYIVTLLTRRSPFKIKKEKQKTKQNKTINTIAVIGFFKCATGNVIFILVANGFRY